MSHVADGNRAEDAAAKFLEYKGCTIIARNWKTPVCEIDIIATRRNVIYFCEVKYRRTAYQGRGLDYITPKKQRQMRFAAEVWLAQNNWQGECQLCAVEVSGPQFSVTAAVREVLM